MANRTTTYPQAIGLASTWEPEDGEGSRRRWARTITWSSVWESPTSKGGRNTAPVHVGMREFREIFLFPFEAAVREAEVKEDQLLRRAASTYRPSKRVSYPRL